MNEVEFWHWWVVAAGFGALDMLAQSGLLLWLGVAALMVGLVVFVLPDLAWQSQALLFVGFAVGVLAAAWLSRRFGSTATGRARADLRGAQPVGHLIVLETPILNGRGRAFVGDTLWTVEGRDRPAGATVRVVGSDGVLLQVEDP